MNKPTEDPWSGLDAKTRKRAMQIARDMPDEYPEGYAIFLARQEALEGEGDA